MENKTKEKLQKLSEKIREECLDSEEAADLIEKEFRLTWNQNKEVQHTAKNVLIDVTAVMSKTDWTKENWNKLKAILEEKYDVDGKAVYYYSEKIEGNYNENSKEM